MIGTPAKAAAPEIVTVLEPHPRRPRAQVTSPTAGQYRRSGVVAGIVQGVSGGNRSQRSSAGAIEPAGRRGEPRSSENRSQKSPLAPVLGGEGSGVRGLTRGSARPLTPTPLPRVRGRGASGQTLTAGGPTSATRAPAHPRRCGAGADAGRGASCRGGCRGPRRASRPGRRGGREDPSPRRRWRRSARRRCRRGSGRRPASTL